MPGVSDILEVEESCSVECLFVRQAWEKKRRKKNPEGLYLIHLGE